MTKKLGCFEIAVVLSPIDEALSLNYYRKITSSKNFVLTSRENDVVKNFLEREQILFEFFEETPRDELLEQKIVYLTTSKQDPMISKLIELSKKNCLEINYQYFGYPQLSLLSIKSVMERLRSSEGCSFDRSQTHKSLEPYLIEESYEVIEAIENGSYDNLSEELGDLLLQIIFHSQIAEEHERFKLEDVLEKLEKKLIRRHPHVFGGKYANGENGLLSWEEIKAVEKKGEHNRKGEKNVSKKSVLEQVPKSAPALIKAEKLQKICNKLGFDWEDSLGAYKKFLEECQELKDAYLEEDWEKIEEELGDVIFSLVNLARFLDISPELSLHKTIRKFQQRFGYIEDKVNAQRGEFRKYSLEELDKYWEEAKKRGI